MSIAILSSELVIDALRALPEWPVSLFSGFNGLDRTESTDSLIDAIVAFPHAIAINEETSVQAEHGAWLSIPPLNLSVQIDRAILQSCLVTPDPNADMTTGRKFRIGDMVRYTNNYGVVFEGYMVAGHSIENGKPCYFLAPKVSYWMPVPETALELMSEPEGYPTASQSCRDAEDDEITTDLLEDIESLPLPVQEVLQEFASDDETYENCEALLKALEPLGYTFDNYLDAIPVDLRKIQEDGL